MKNFRSYPYKILVAAGLILVLWAALQMVFNLVEERSQLQESAEQSIWRSYAGQQTLNGPIIVLPYKEVLVESEAKDAKGRKTQTQYREVTRQLLVFPKSLQVQTEIKPSERYRGIHKAIVYEAASQWTGTFALPDLKAATAFEKSAGHVRFELGEPFVALGVSDMRGLAAAPVMQLAGKSLEMEQGAQLNGLGQGLHADLDLRGAAGKPADARVVPFSLTLSLLGSRSIAFAPVADMNTFSMRSAWPHPSFDGDFLPRQRTVDASGFRAEWSVSALNTHVRERLLPIENGERTQPSVTAPANAAESISVTLIDPVNGYVRVERAIKYGLLFVLLTFAGFYVFEQIKRLRIHPIQYLLVGLALTLFFLMLVSLSEHVTFLFAYLAASAACIGLLAFYLTFVLHSWRRGASFAALIAALYGALYGILVSEDNALLLGSTLLFLVLASIMTVTRRVDWYNGDMQSISEKDGGEG